MEDLARKETKVQMETMEARARKVTKDH
jgi:hypothetical protein